MSNGNPPAGYYADPSVPGYIRYWDGTGWVAGTGRPAPEAVADQVPPQQWEPQQPQQLQQQLQPQQLQQQSPPQLQPQQQAAVPSAPVTASAAESVSTMVVPSAFGGRANGYGGGYGNGYGYADPFAGLPGSPAAAEPGEQPEVEAKVLELATPGSRVLARIIDLGIAGLACSPVTAALVLVAHRHDHQYVQHLDAEATTTYTTLGMDGFGIALWAGAVVLLLAVAIMLEGSQLRRGGQSVGKRLAGIRVVGLGDGAPITRRSLGTRRALLFWVLAILPLLDIVALGGVLWGRPYRQGAHERLTATVTVRA